MAALGLILMEGARPSAVGVLDEAAASAPPHTPRQVAAPGVPVVTGPTVLGERGLEDPRTPVFAVSTGVEVRLPTARPVVIGFHEASGDRAQPFTPVGRLTVNRNATRLNAPDDAPGPAYMVLASRGRPNPPTSSVDVAMEPDDTVVAPVSGVVVDVADYWLYGRYADQRVDIRPSGTHDTRLVVLHVQDALVRPGDEVVAGLTPIASPRLLPFSSHIDREAGRRIPHVHLEMVLDD